MIMMSDKYFCGSEMLLARLCILESFSHLLTAYSCPSINGSQLLFA